MWRVYSNIDGKWYHFDTPNEFGLVYWRSIRATILQTVPLPY